MEQICAGTTLSGPALFTYFRANDCPAVFSTILNTQSDGTSGYNPANLPQVQADVQTLFTNYLTSNILTDNVNDPRYNSFQNDLLQLCTDPRLPGVCVPFIENYCKAYSRATISTSPILASFCGCYTTPDPDYSKYAGPECDPLCHRVTTVQRPNGVGSVLRCSDTVCVIDDVAINLEQSTVGGGVNISQICPGCQGNSLCVCIASSPNLSNLFAQAGIGNQFQQLCGTQSVCLQDTATGPVTIPCANIVPSVPPVKENISWVVIVIAVAVVVFVIILFLAIKYSK